MAFSVRPSGRARAGLGAQETPTGAANAQQKGQTLMPAKMFPVHPATTSLPHPFIVSLVPLLTNGQAALAPDLSAGVFRMHLCLVATRWHNAFNELTIRMADDLFACAAREGRNYDPFPKGGELVQVTLNVELVGSDRPHPVQIVPPDTLTFQNPEDAARILPLLERRGFRALLPATNFQI